MTAMTTTCTHHCKTCGTHFVSLTAFDKHRAGPWEDRRCEDPAGLGMTGHTGTCNLTSDEKRHGVVWTTRTTN